MPPIAALLLAAALRQGGCAYDVPKPELGTIAVTADTVWFHAPARPPVALERRTRRWSIPPRDRPMPALDSGDVRAHDALWCRSGSDTVRIAPGLALVPSADAAEPADQDERPRVRWTIAHDGRRPKPVRLDSRLVPPPPSGPPDDYELPPTSFSTTVSAMVRDGDLLWLGLFGGYPFTMERPLGPVRAQLGGLLRYSLRTGALASFAPAELGHDAVTGLAVAGGMLWIGTQESRPSERNALFPGALVRLGRDGRFARFTDSTAMLPGTTFLALAGAGDTLWALTAEGPAVLDARTLRGSRRWFRTVVALDSTFERLDTLPPRVTITDEERARRMLVLLAEALGITERRAFLEAAAGAPVDELVDALEMYEYGRGDPIREEMELAGASQYLDSTYRVPGLRPFARAAMRGRSWPLALAFFGPAGDPAWRAELRAAMREVPLRYGAPMASLLADSSDATGIAFLRGLLDDPRLLADTARDLDGLPAYVTVLDRLRLQPDSTLTPSLARLAREPGWLGIVAGRALRAIPTDEARVLSLEAALAAPLVAGDAQHLLEAHWSALSDSVPSHGTAAERAAFLRVQRRLVALADSLVPLPWHPGAPETSRLSHAVARVGVLRDVESVPALVRIVAHRGVPADSANEALIRLTGVEPPGARHDEAASIGPFWTAWWRAHGATFTPVPRETGDAALARWRRRRDAH